MTPEDLVNVVTRGISPLSLLQYGLVDFTQWDSVFLHLNRANRSHFIFSENNYDHLFDSDLNYTTKLDTSSILNFKRSLAEFIEKEHFHFLYSNTHFIHYTLS
jgi:hypothetical protein